MHRTRPGDLLRRSIPVVVTAASAAAAWVVLAVGSLALSPWGPRNRASALLFFAGSAAVAALVLAAYPWGRWLTSRRPVHLALAVGAVLAVAAAALCIALVDV